VVLGGGEEEGVETGSVAEGMGSGGIIRMSVAKCTSLILLCKAPRAVS